MDREKELVRLAGRGDTAAMRKIYDVYVGHLTAVCSRYIPNDEDVRDLMQESFIKIFSSVGSFEFRGEGSLKAWMTRVVVNDALRFIKQNLHVGFTELTDAELDIADEELEVDHVPSDVIFGFIRTLPDGYRAVFNLNVVEGRSHREIAALLGISESTSASQLHRAKAMLASKIRQYQSNIIRKSL